MMYLYLIWVMKGHLYHYIYRLFVLCLGVPRRSIKKTNLFSSLHTNPPIQHIFILFLSIYYRAGIKLISWTPVHFHPCSSGITRVTEDLLQSCNLLL